jgi:hypothetical protein
MGGPYLDIAQVATRVEHTERRRYDARLKLREPAALRAPKTGLRPGDRHAVARL